MLAYHWPGMMYVGCNCAGGGWGNEPRPWAGPWLGRMVGQKCVHIRPTHIITIINQSINLAETSFSCSFEVRER